MAQTARTKGKPRRPLRDDSLPLGRKNFMILGAGIVAIVAGYLAMLEGSVEGSMPLVVAPILLVIGYCVLIPLGILYRQPSASSIPAAEKPAGRS